MTARIGQQVYFNHELLDMRLPAKVVSVTKRHVVIELLDPPEAVLKRRALTHRQAAVKLDAGSCLDGS